MILEFVNQTACFAIVLYELIAVKLLIDIDIKLATANNGSKVITGNASSKTNETLMKAIVRSLHWNDQLINGERKSLQEIVDYEKISSASYVSRIIKLRFLVLAIIEAIISGTQQVEWTIKRLLAVKE